MGAKNTNTGELSVDLSDDVLETRREAWQPPESTFGSDVIWKYAQLVGVDRYGVLTHPGAKAEKSCYADI